MAHGPPCALALLHDLEQIFSHIFSMEYFSSYEFLKVTMKNYNFSQSQVKKTDMMSRPAISLCFRLLKQSVVADEFRNLDS